MTFQTLGNRQNPAVMLIHGMISSGADCEPFGRCLADEYYVILPTLDGHGNDGTDLLPLEGELTDSSVISKRMTSIPWQWYRAVQWGQKSPLRSSKDLNRKTSH